MPQLVGRWKPERMAERVPRVKIPGIPNVDGLKHESMKIQYLSQGALIIKRKPKVGDKFVATLGRLRENGRTDLEMALFVHRCFFLAENYPPKAKVELCVTQTEGGIRFKSHFFIKEVLEPGPYASNPEKFCQHWAECGGCQFNGTRYARQLIEKRAWLAKAFPTERVLRIVPAVHGHNRFEHHVKWQQDGNLAVGPEGFRSELETSPNECGRLPKRLYRAMREAAETFEKNYANILEAICGRRRDGNYEVVLNVFGTSTAKHNVKRRKDGLREFSPCLDATDINIFRDRNPFVVGLTSRGGHHQIFGRKNTVRQHVKLEFVKKVYEEGWMGSILGVYDENDNIPHRDILVNTEISTTWGYLRKGIEPEEQPLESEGTEQDLILSVDASGTQEVCGESRVRTNKSPDGEPVSCQASTNDLASHLIDSLRDKARILEESAPNLNAATGQDVKTRIKSPGFPSSGSSGVAEFCGDLLTGSSDGDTNNEENPLSEPLSKKARRKMERKSHMNMSLPKKQAINYSQYVIHLDLELGFWKIPGRACIGSVADVLLEKFVVPMLDRVFQKSRHHSERRICIWEAGGSWPLSECMATVFNRLKTSKEISVVSFQHPDDVELRRGSLDFSISRQQREFEKTVRKKKREDTSRRLEARKQHQSQLLEALRKEIVSAEDAASDGTSIGKKTRLDLIEEQVAARLEQELVLYDKREKEHSSSYFPPLTNLVADLNEQSTLERILVLTQTQDKFDYDYTTYKSAGNVREELGAFHINKGIYFLMGSLCTLREAKRS